MAHAADAYPEHPIRMLVPFSAGSTTDFAARLLGQKMAEHWGQQVVVDNRPSAGGVVASELLLAAPPDGYSVLLNTYAQAISPAIFRKLGYDPIKELQPVVMRSAIEVPHFGFEMPAWMPNWAYSALIRLVNSGSFRSRGGARGRRRRS